MQIKTSLPYLFINRKFEKRNKTKIERQITAQQNFILLFLNLNAQKKKKKKKKKKAMSQC